MRSKKRSFRRRRAAAKAVVAAIGAEMHNEALKHSLAMGLDEAVRVWDDVAARRQLAGLCDGRRRRRPEDRRRRSGDLRQGKRGCGHGPAHLPDRAQARLDDVELRLEDSGGRLRRRDDQGRAAAGRRQADRHQQAARRDQRDEGHQRAALPVVHRHPQGVEGGHSGLVAGRSGHRRADACTRASRPSRICRRATASSN